MDGETKTIDLSNKLFNIITIFLVLIGILVLSTAVYYFKSLPENAPHQIMVRAEGKSYVIPDIAKASFGVTTEGKDIKEITKENTDKMNKIIDDLKNLGVKTEDIQTTSYNLSPQYNWTNSGRSFLGYSLHQQIIVKIRDFTKIGDIVASATNNGANTIGDLQFEVDDMDAFVQEARAEAIKKAKEKAKTLAEQTGLKIGKLINVSDNADSLPRPIYETAFGMGGAADAKALAPQIEPGQKEINITVFLTYEVR